MGAATYLIIGGGCANPQSPQLKRWGALDKHKDASTSTIRKYEDIVVIVGVGSGLSWDLMMLKALTIDNHLMVTTDGLVMFENWFKGVGKFFYSHSKSPTKPIRITPCAYLDKRWYAWEHKNAQKRTALSFV